MFAPAGIAGIVFAHRRVLRPRLLARLLPAYAIAALAGVVVLLTGIFIIEFTYGWSSQSYAADATIALFGVSWSPAGPWPWLVMAAGAAAGLYALLHHAIPAVRGAWDEIGAALEREGP